MRSSWMLGMVLVASGALSAGCNDVCLSGDGCPQRDAQADVQHDASVCPGMATSGSADCDWCRDQSCCDEVTACAGKEKCGAWLDCVNDCGNDAACRANCYATLHAGDEKAALAACEARFCGDACQLGQCGGLVSPHASDECAACEQANCCAEDLACAQDQDCQRWIDCVGACPDLQGSCPMLCFGRDAPEGAEADTPRQACASRACASCNLAGACGYWAGWSPPACEECAVQSCCGVLKACADDAECLAHAACAQRCRNNDNQPSCYRGCDARFPNRVGLDHVRFNCMNTTCGQACGTDIWWTCGGVFYADDPCKTCSDASCCALATVCGEDPGCAQAFICLRACAGDAACEAACEAAAPVVAAAYLQAFRTCLADSCGAECS